MSNKIATIDWIKRQVGNVPIPITPTSNSALCPIYSNLTNGSVIPQANITIPRCSVDTRRYSSNQLVCEKDIDIILYGLLTVRVKYDGLVTAYTSSLSVTEQSINGVAIFKNKFTIGEIVTIVVPSPVDGTPSYTYSGLNVVPDKLYWGSGDTSVKTVYVSGIEYQDEYYTYEDGVKTVTIKENTDITVEYEKTKFPAVSSVTYPSLTTSVTSNHPFKLVLKNAETNTYNVIPPGNPSDTDQLGFVNFYPIDLNYFSASAEVRKQTSGLTFDLTILSNSGGTATVSIDGSPSTYTFVGNNNSYSIVVPIPEGKNVFITRPIPENYTSGGTESYSGLFSNTTDIIFTEASEIKTVTFEGLLTISPISSITWSVPSSSFTYLDDNKIIDLSLVSSVTQTTGSRLITTTPTVDVVRTTSQGFTANCNRNIVTITAPREKSDIDIRGSFIVESNLYGDAAIYVTLTANEYYTLHLFSNSGGTATVVSDGTTKILQLQGGGNSYTAIANILKDSNVQISRTIPPREEIGGEVTYEGLQPSVTAITFAEAKSMHTVVYYGTANTQAVSSVTWSCPNGTLVMDGDKYYDLSLTKTVREIVQASSVITYPKVVISQHESHGFLASANNNIITIDAPEAQTSEVRGTFIVMADGYDQAVINTYLEAKLEEITYTITDISYTSSVGANVTSATISYTGNKLINGEIVNSTPLTENVTFGINTSTTETKENSGTISWEGQSFQWLIIQSPDGSIIITDADYIVITYDWSDSGDVDIRVGFYDQTDRSTSALNSISSSFSNHVGFSQGRVIGSNDEIQWAGDSTSPGEETILIDIAKLLSSQHMSTLRAQNINELCIKLECAWYSGGYGNVYLRVDSYSGGTMQLNYHTYYNEGGQRLGETQTLSGYCSADYSDYSTAGYVYLDVQSKSVTMTRSYRPLNN